MGLVSTEHRQTVILKREQDVPHVPVLDDNAVAKRLMFGVYVGINPKAGVVVEWSEKIEAAVSGTREIRVSGFRRGIAGTNERVVMRRHHSSN
jgi:hypothetical protein